MGSKDDDSSARKESMINNDDTTEEKYFVFEFALISGQNLAIPQWSLSMSLGGRMHTYAEVWIDKDVKLLTRIDEEGGSNPLWNHRFLFIVDKRFLTDDETKCINVDIYAAGAASLALDGGYVGTSRIKLKPLMEDLKKKPKCMLHEGVWKHELFGARVVQGIIHVQTKLMPFKQFCENTDMVLDEAVQQKRLSIMCLYCQPRIKRRTFGDLYMLRFGIVFISACWLFARYALPKH